MAQISIVKYSDIKEARRFDAEYFKPEYLETLKVIKKAKIKPLSYFIKDGYRVVYENTHILSIEDVLKQKNVNFLQASDIDGCFLKYELGKVKYSDWKRYPNGRVKRGEILIEVKGNAEKIAIVPDDYPLNTLISGSLYKFTPVNISGEFLLVWLTCKHGQNLKSKLKRNLMVHFIGKEDLYNIPIPLLPESFQFQIEKIVKDAHQKQTQSKQLYQEAEKLLLTELGLLNYKPKHQLTFETTKKAVEQAKRFDSEYFQPFYEDVEKRILKNGFVLMKSVCSAINYGTVPTSPYTNNGSGIPYIKGLNLKNIQIKKDKLDRIENTENLPKKFYTKKGDIVISQMGTVGDVGVITEDEEGWLFASFTIRVRLNNFDDFNPFFIGLYIQNIAKKYYLLRNIAQASVRQNTDLPTIKNMPIPLINPKIQTQIAEKIQESHQLRKESKELLEMAKRKVEEEIEKG